ncbi:MAG: glycosyltransferase family 4 protein [Verrucomicrobiota bacterium]
MIDIVRWIKSKMTPIRVHHGYRKDAVGGPFVKLERMNQYFPDWDRYYNIIYSVSGCDFPVDRIERAKKRGVKIVCHCNSCWHPAYAEDWRNKNRFLEPVHNDLADFIVYGSEQARLGASLYLGKSNAPWEKIYNAVDTDFFVPNPQPMRRPPMIMAAGLQSIRHRLDPLIHAMALIAKELPGARLIIAGKLKAGAGLWDCGPETVAQMIEASGFKDVDFIPQYKQEEAPSIYHRADVLVHLKHMDWTPNVVAEAMACGIPVVHTGNGGVPEIVKDSGISLNVPTDWETIQVPTPEQVADGVVRAYRQREELAKKARSIAVEDYSLSQWAKRHEVIFKNLLKLT